MAEEIKEKISFDILKKNRMKIIKEQVNENFII
jgi:hypothetical protein